ncbi:hypothetical protein NpPPO83_00003262 [Neofusicoccum parvum]|uniref:Uncharacterized protein n=1 Tax=Neofusicoccum parvum TaxID=310453 RepID=A0ACB5RZN3_9PEZI|nr:hypothetical protein NpPPO83_00003262 [Neofusicoccum parvum]
MENNSFSNAAPADRADPASPASPAPLSTTNVSEATMWEIPTSGPASPHQETGASISDISDISSSSDNDDNDDGETTTTNITTWATSLPPPPTQFAHAPPDAETVYTIRSALASLDEAKAQLDALRACGTRQRARRAAHQEAAYGLLGETAATIRRALGRLRAAQPDGAAERNLARAARDVEVALGATGDAEGLRVERAGRNYPHVVLRLEKVLRRMRREVV